MPKAKSNQPADYIVPLNMNGLAGRMLYMPASKNKKRNILFVYGHHSSLERWWGVVDDLSQYGSVTMPDMPGFGGMQPFYKLGRKPSVDNLADYLASFIKLRFKGKITIVGLSFGFVVVTRMLQRYPKLTSKVDLLVSVVGFSRYDDFKFSKVRYNCYLLGSKLLSMRLPAFLFRNIALNPAVIRTAYGRTYNAKEKFSGLGDEDKVAMMNFEIVLWHANDVRTHMHTTAEFLKINNCNKSVKLPLYHITVKNDRYFDRDRVEQHLKVIYEDVHIVDSKMDSHAPSIIADRKTASPLIPKSLRQVLGKSPK